MALKRLRYTGLRALLRAEGLAAEDGATASLLASMKPVARRGYFSRAEFLAMCRWKSPRAIRHYRRNSARTIRRLSRQVLATRSERGRLELLCSLHGVSVPMASAILTLVDPQRYGVIDIRTWQLLYAIKSVTRRPRGVGFSFDDWEHYLTTLRLHAKELGAPVRTVEHTLFRCHKRYQLGRLYDWGRPTEAATRKQARGRA